MSDKFAESAARLPAMAQELTHSLRNPLNSIILNSTLLREMLDHQVGANGDAREAQDLVIAIEQQARRIQAALEEFLQRVA